MPQLPLFEIAGIELPSDLENLGFFFVGSPGSGKTRAIKRLLSHSDPEERRMKTALTFGRS